MSNTKIDAIIPKASQNLKVDATIDKVNNASKGTEAAAKKAADSASTPGKKTTSDCEIDRRKIIIGVSIGVLAAAIAIPLGIKLCSRDDDDDNSSARIGSAKLAFVSPTIPQNPETDTLKYSNTQSL